MKTRFLTLFLLLICFLAKSACFHSTTPNSFYNAPYDGTIGSQFIYNSTCNSTYTILDSWIHITNIDGRIIDYNVDLNPDNSPRTGTIEFDYPDGSIGYFYVYQQANPNSSGSGCISFYNGNTGDQEFIDAANTLCQNEIISNYLDASIIYNNIKIKDLALINFKALFDGNNSFSDNFPNPFLDIDNLSSDYKKALLAMLYLEYPNGNEPDGISPLPREYFNVKPEFNISNGKAIKVLLEAFNIKPDNSGYNPNGTYSSSFYNDLPVNNKYYGYFKKAYNLGIYSNFTCSSNPNYCCPNSYMSIRDAYVILYNILYYLSSNPPSINSSSYFEPNSFTISTLGNKADIDRGVFLHYEDPSFSIEGGGLPLEFIHSYHSNWTEIPRYVTESDYEPISVQRFNPIGNGWTHNYNIYMQRVYDLNTSIEKYLFWWDDGTVDIYDPNQSKWLTASGKYYELFPTIYNGNSGYILRTKDKTLYTFVGGSDYTVLDLAEIQDKNGNKIKLSYESGNSLGTPYVPNRLKYVTDNVSGRKLTFNYQSNTNYIQNVSDNSGRNIYFNVNSNSDLINFTDAKNQTFTYNYGTNAYDMHLLKSIQKPKGNVIYNTYNERKLKQTKNNTYTVDVDFQSPYSGNYYTQSTIDITKNGQQLTTTVQHNNEGLPINVSSNTQNISYTYGDASNNPTLPTIVRDNNLGIYNVLQYDNNGNLLRISKVASSGNTLTESFQYDSYYNVLRSHTDSKGYTTYYSIDGNGNISRVDYPDGNNMQFARNSNGNITNIYHQDGKVTNLSYNGYGNLSQFGINGTNVINQAIYDAVSRVTTITDPKQTISQYIYDANDNVINATNDINGLYEQTAYSYDANDNVIRIKDAKNQSTYLDYDFSTDDLITETYGSYNKQWTYNTDGTVNSYTNKNGFTANNQYYPKNDYREGLLKNDGYAEYNYRTTTRNLQTVTYNGKTMTFDYDEFNRINYINYSDFSTNSVNYKYDNNGNIIEVYYPLGYKAYYSYDELNRLISVKDINNTELAHYFYFPDGKLQQENRGNNTVIRYYYDNANRLDSITNLRSNGTIISSYHYVLDNNGNHTEESIYEPNGSGEFQSLPVNQNYASNYAYDNMNRLTGTNFNSWYYYNSGAHIQHGNYTFTYDQRDNMLTARDAGGNTTNLNCEYDAFEGRRLKNNTIYVLDPLNNNNVLMEIDKTTLQPTAVYYYGLGLISNYLPQEGFTGYYYYDSRGSTTNIIDKFGNISHTYRYGTFGDVTNQTEWFPQPYKYVGKFGVQYDSKNLYYMRNRCYNPYYGRFYSEDPIWSTNLYPYADNNPITNIDPSGKYAETAIDIASFMYDLNEYRKKPSLGNFAFLFLDGITTALPIVAGGGAAGRVSVKGVEGVYHLATSEGRYIGQAKNLIVRVSSHFKKGGKLSETKLIDEIFHSMPGSTKIEREVYEQYLISKYGLGNLINIRNPMGGRMKQYYEMINKVIKKYSLPK